MLFINVFDILSFLASMKVDGTVDKVSVLFPLDFSNNQAILVWHVTFCI